MVSGLSQRAEQRLPVAGSSSCTLQLLHHASATKGGLVCCPAARGLSPLQWLTLQRAAGVAAVKAAIKILQDIFGNELDQDGTNIIHSLCTNQESVDDAKDAYDFSELIVMSHCKWCAAGS